MTAGSQMVLDTLKKNFGVELSKAEIMEKAGVSMGTVNGSITGLKRRATKNGVDYLTERSEEIEVNGKPKTIVYIMLTEAGLALDPTADEE